MILYIKNMVCGRCKMVVKSEFDQLGLPTISVELGQVELKEAITESQKEILLKNLQAIGFDIIDDKKSITAEKIKNLIVDLVHHKNNELKINLSDYLVENLHQDYSTLSNLFSELENITIEKYFISQKIEKVKELLVYNELSLSEIADILNYSNVAHLSNQFKKVTGFTPTHFKQLKDKKRIQIENL
ncbi:AraC family transcriptional regulator [Flavobacterium sp. Fl-77]|uniref:AraC family transcriptional regulator n=1 Tax=Flavobacterium flavipigmentatum TaxID=2893884 RepID=A0AAJ2SCA0_9FLAO|nr:MULTISPECIES: AraC family transcriptional regulator [unclassified Flavobacterium]MDX6182346.1 AraC family transcriptional regulator [Flavobacterium sp. Fl-33]MDX6185741.1 AraC family transcriptional regulator [Flavobacterium sp. Fl-77]UFH38923.1 AraC family transcriptional regulator [Flavobacterium sp. F-70]